jgi:putative salt-induced outer membrane protein YdiY
MIIGVSAYIMMAHSNLLAQAELRMQNGAVLFGEVKKMEFAKLSLDTDDFDLIKIDWEPIVHLSAPGPFNVTLADGRVLAGAIEMDSVNFTILGVVPVVVPRRQVGSFEDFDVGFWNGVSASVDIGANLVRGNNYVTSLSAGVDLGWESKETAVSISSSSIINDQEDSPGTRRYTGRVGIAHVVVGRIRAGAVASYERDENQELDARILATAFVAFRPISYQRSRLDILLGAGPTYEKYTADLNGDTIGEGRLGFAFTAKPNNDTSLDLSTYLYPTIPDFDRVRIESDFVFRVEIIEDLTLNFDAYYRFNNQPPEGIGKHDYGTTLGLGWSY